MTDARRKHVPRLHVDRTLTIGDAVALGAEQAHHLGAVLRLRSGADLVLFNGHGGEYMARLSTLNRKSAQALVLEHRQPRRESPLAVTLAQAVARGDRMDFAVAKAVELGVAAIQPLFTERGQIKLTGERLDRKHRHWQAVARSAAEQSGREILPVVHAPCRLDDWLADAAGERRLMLDPRAPGGPVEGATTPTSVSLLIGPESGFSDQELVAARASGFEGVRLGPRILRTETAGPAALAALQTRWGDFG